MRTPDLGCILKKSATSSRVLSKTGSILDATIAASIDSKTQTLMVVEDVQSGSLKVSNPFDLIERLPQDEAEHKKLMSDAFDFGLDHIAGQLNDFPKDHDQE